MFVTGFDGEEILSLSADLTLGLETLDMLTLGRTR